jgi:hypothetical protein
MTVIVLTMCKAFMVSIRKLNMKKIGSRIRNQVLKRIYGMPFLQKHADIAYRAAVDNHVINLPVLSTTDLTLVETLKREGVATTSLEALAIPSTLKMFDIAKVLMPKIPGSVSGDKNEYVVHATPGQMVENPEIFLWGLEKRILNIAENYFGLPVAYHGAYYRRDIANLVEHKSRLWHIDTEERQVLKVIIYLTNVSEDGGPFQYIPQPTTVQIARKLKYKCGYIQDKNMAEVLSPSNYRSCTGISGTVVFAATGSIFHRGKKPVTSDRFAVFFDYTSRLPKYPFSSQYSLEQADLLSFSSQLDQYQRQSLLWQEYGLD